MLSESNDLPQAQGPGQPPNLSPNETERNTQHKGAFLEGDGQGAGHQLALLGKKPLWEMRGHVCPEKTVQVPHI